MALTKDEVHVPYNANMDEIYIFLGKWGYGYVEAACVWLPHKCFDNKCNQE